MKNEKVRIQSEYVLKPAANSDAENERCYAQVVRLDDTDQIVMPKSSIEVYNSPDDFVRELTSQLLEIVREDLFNQERTPQINVTLIIEYNT